MATLVTRKSRVFSISFPEPMASNVEKIAREESRSISEVFREAFRAYQLHNIQKLHDRMLANLPPHPYTEEDVEALVHEVRREECVSQVA